MYEEYFQQLNKLDEKYLVEMSIINPQMCKKSSIQIELEQKDEGPIPHIHVYLDKERNPKNCAYVRLDKAAYAPHHKDGKHLRGKQKEEFLQIMTSLWTKEYSSPITGYQAAVELWIDTFGETLPFMYDEQGFPIMPDYKNNL